MRINHEKEPIEKNAPPRRSMNREILWISSFFVVLFLTFGVYMVRFLYIEREDYVTSPYNTRQDLLSQTVVRGKILGNDGYVLAKTVTDENGEEVREYPYGPIFAHAVGYSDKGKSGIESSMNYYLLTSHDNLLYQVQMELQDQKVQGDSVITTLNPTLQKTAWDAMEGYRGAVIVMEPSTGKILAMVSRPSYDPNTLAADWDWLISEENTESNLLNRSTKGLYPPGSTFKIITALEYYREYGMSGVMSYSYFCDGSYRDGETVVSCFNGTEHGEETLREAFAYSCNASFCDIGMRLNIKKYRQTCENLFFNREFDFPFAVTSGSFSLTEKSPVWEIMQTAIGQGQTLVTPLQMAMITSGIANNGMVMTPYMVDSIVTAEGKAVKQFAPSSYRQIMTGEEANYLTDLMTGVVEEGTGTLLQSELYQAAVKTGTAEYKTGSDLSHAWVTGFAPADSPKLVVTVVLEDAGTGGSTATAVAKEIFDAYFGAE